MGRKMLFKNFLLKYCQYLTDSSSASLLKMAEMLNDNPRAEEPLLLYALYNKKDHNQFRNRLRPELKTRFDLLKNESLKYTSLEEMFKCSNNLDCDFQKVYNTYKNHLQETSASTPYKESFCVFFNKQLKEKQLTSYKVCKDLNLNNANFSYFLKGQLDKLSVANCERVYEYLKKEEF